jgi:hypothetical protein
MELDLQHPDLATAPSVSQVPRWELYRLLADPVRVRLLALASVEELAVGELAELLGRGSRRSRATQRRCARQGCSPRNATAPGRLAPPRPGAADDPVVADAIGAGRLAVAPTAPSPASTR